MRNDLLIKGVDDESFKNGYDYYHVRMGKGFLDALECPLSLKEPVENEVRKEHGTRMLVSTKIAKRTLTLAFNIHGSTRTEYQANKKAFETMLYKGLIDLKVNDDDHQDIYHLVYTGKSVTYHHSYNGQFGTVTMQFVEPDPTNRTGDANAHVRAIT